MNLHATRQIDTDIRDEMLGVRADARRHLAADVSTDHARGLLAEHVPALVVGRAELLLDSLLGYLMEDAVAELGSEPTPVHNAFYALELRTRIRSSFALDPRTLRFSFDPRLLIGGAAAGGTLLAGSMLIALMLTSVASRVIAGLATLVGAAVAFRIGQAAGDSRARQSLEADLSAYLDTAETQVGGWLAGVEREFADAFDRFLLSARTGDTVH